MIVFKTVIDDNKDKYQEAYVNESKDIAEYTKDFDFSKYAENPVFLVIDRNVEKDFVRIIDTENKIFFDAFVNTFKDIYEEINNIIKISIDKTDKYILTNRNGTIKKTIDLTTMNPGQHNLNFEFNGTDLLFPCLRTARNIHEDNIHEYSANNAKYKQIYVFNKINIFEILYKYITGKNDYIENDYIYIKSNIIDNVYTSFIILDNQLVNFLPYYDENSVYSQNIQDLRNNPFKLYYTYNFKTSEWTTNYIQHNIRNQESAYIQKNNLPKKFKEGIYDVYTNIRFKIEINFTASRDSCANTYIKYTDTNGNDIMIDHIQEFEDLCRDIYDIVISGKQYQFTELLYDTQNVAGTDISIDEDNSYYFNKNYYNIGTTPIKDLHKLSEMNPKHVFVTDMVHCYQYNPIDSYCSYFLDPDSTTQISFNVYKFGDFKFSIDKKISGYPIDYNILTPYFVGTDKILVYIRFEKFIKNIDNKGNRIRTFSLYDRLFPVFESINNEPDNYYYKYKYIYSDLDKYKGEVICGLIPCIAIIEKRGDGYYINDVDFSKLKKYPFFDSNNNAFFTEGYDATVNKIFLNDYEDIPEINNVNDKTISTVTNVRLSLD